jgi:hypothetical protein
LNRSGFYDIAASEESDSESKSAAHLYADADTDVIDDVASDVASVAPPPSLSKQRSAVQQQQYSTPQRALSQQSGTDSADVKAVAAPDSHSAAVYNTSFEQDTSGQYNTVKQQQQQQQQALSPAPAVPRLPLSALKSKSSSGDAPAAAVAPTAAALETSSSRKVTVRSGTTSPVTSGRSHAAAAVAAVPLSPSSARYKVAEAATANTLTAAAAVAVATGSARGGYVVQGKSDVFSDVNMLSAQSEFASGASVQSAQGAAAATPLSSVHATGALGYGIVDDDVPDELLYKQNSAVRVQAPAAAIDTTVIVPPPDYHAPSPKHLGRDYSSNNDAFSSATAGAVGAGSSGIEDIHSARSNVVKAGSSSSVHSSSRNVTAATASNNTPSVTSVPLVISSSRQQAAHTNNTMNNNSVVSTPPQSGRSSVPARGAFSPGGRGAVVTPLRGNSSSNSSVGVVPVKRRRSLVEVASDAVSGAVETVYTNPYVLNLSLALLAVSFAVELYPSVPR